MKPAKIEGLFHEEEMHGKIEEFYAWADFKCDCLHNVLGRTAPLRWEIIQKIRENV